jgi:hypothetical protein
MSRSQRWPQWSEWMGGRERQSMRVVGGVRGRWVEDLSCEQHMPRMKAAQPTPCSCG